MKKHLHKWPLIIAASIICFLIWWGYKAEVSETGAYIQIPRWCAGSSNVSYNIMIHRSQINRYGTIMNGRVIWVGAFPAWPRSPFADLFKLKEPEQQKPQRDPKLERWNAGRVDEL